MSKISNLKSALGAGLRTTKFQVQIIVPNGIKPFTGLTTVTTQEGNVSVDGVTDDRFTLLCKAASFPQKTIGTTEIWVDGKKAVLQGDTEFEQTWDVTFYETELHSIRKNFLAWQESIDTTEKVTHDESSSGGTGYIHQLDGRGNITATYKFHNIWPQTVAAIDMAVDSVNAIGEFTVTLAFDFWTLVEGESQGDTAVTDGGTQIIPTTAI